MISSMLTRSPVARSLAVLLAATAMSRGEERVETYPDGGKKAVYAVTADGERNGPFAEFHPDGRPASKGAYRKGKLHGPFQSHHPDGKVKTKVTYKDGMPTGKLVEYGESGAVLRSAQYREGKLHGAFQEFAAGRLIRDEFWVGGELLVPKSAAQIAATLKAIETSAARTVGEFPPASDPWRAALADAGLQATREAALRRLQAYRYLCDVPWEDLALDRAYVAHCEAACDVMHRVGTLTHTPENPGMPEDDYRFAYAGTSSSNIFSSPSMIDAITAFMDDSDASNIDRLGHRRWCINPGMLRTGVAGNHGYSAMWSLDCSRQEAPDYDFVSFPPRGLTPVSFFKPGYAWSCSLNPRKYAAPEPTKVKATIRPCRFNPHQDGVEKAAQPLQPSHFGVDLGGFGIPNCIIFRPADVAVKPGASYWVEITGLEHSDGTDATIGYLVSFIGL